jgi:hypothetical protein
MAKKGWARTGHPDATLVVNLHEAKALGPLLVDGQAGNGDVGLRQPVVVHELHVVHAVPALPPAYRQHEGNLR